MSSANFSATTKAVDAALRDKPQVVTIPVSNKNGRTYRRQVQYCGKLLAGGYVEEMTLWNNPIFRLRDQRDDAAYTMALRAIVIYGDFRVPPYDLHAVRKGNSTLLFLSHSAFPGPGERDYSLRGNAESIFGDFYQVVDSPCSVEVFGRRRRTIENYFALIAPSDEIILKTINPAAVLSSGVFTTPSYFLWLAIPIGVQKSKFLEDVVLPFGISEPDDAGQRLLDQALQQIPS